MKPSHRLLFAAILIGVAIACNSILPTDEPPGVGEKAERGYWICNQIIAALEQYRTDKGEYPETLDALVPDYFPEVPKTVNDQPIEYEKTPESFSLTFRYYGPGMNWCVYTPEMQWDCSGAY